MKNIPIFYIVNLVLLVACGSLHSSDPWLEMTTQRPSIITQKQPYRAFRQQALLYRPFMRPSMVKIWSEQPTQPVILQEQQPKTTWRDRLAQLKAKVQEKFQQLKSKITAQSQKEQLELQEKELNDARYYWHRIMKERDWGIKRFFGQRTKHQEREFNAIHHLLNQYDVIAQERVLSNEEKSEIEQATAKIISLPTSEFEKETIKAKEKNILTKKPRPLKEKVKKVFREKKEEKIHDALKHAVKKFNLVDYVKKRIVTELKKIFRETTLISDSQYDRLAETLIIEAGKKKSDEELQNDWIGPVLTESGYTEIVHEKARENIKWHILNLPKEIDEKFPKLSKSFQEIEKQFPTLVKPALKYVPALQQKALEYVPVWEARLLPVIAEELIEEKSRQIEP